MVSFECSREEHEIAQQIAARAHGVARRLRFDYPVRDALMDIVATHANGCRLRLADLLGADDFNFNHDVFGIRRHIDRQTGRLGGFFVPRFAAPQ